MADENLAIIEIVYDDGPEICIANEIWLSGDRLTWPPKTSRGLNQRKFLNLTPKSNWLEFTEFNVLQRGLKSIQEANERLNFYCSYDNTQDKIQVDAQKQLRRRHPVLYVENHLDYNNMFDQLNEGCTSTPNVSLKDKQKGAKSTLCFLCGIVPSISIKCDACGSKILCMDCDKLYHKHPVRNAHSREIIENASIIPKNIEVPRQLHESQAQPSTSTKFVDLSGTDDQDLLIPRNREKVTKGRPQISKFSLKAKLSRKHVSKGVIHDTQSDNQYSEELPTLSSVPTQKVSQMIKEAASSKALGWSNNKENQNEPNLDIVLKREKELQELCGSSNNIEESKQQKKQAKTVRVKKDMVMKSSAKRKPTANSGGNKAKAAQAKQDKLMTSSAKLTTQVLSSGSSNVKPTADSDENKIAKKIECLQSILLCMICGSPGQIQCDECNSVTLCVKCDITYHAHLLRSGHTRHKLAQETQKLDIKKPETAPLHKIPRPPPPLLAIPIANMSKTGSLNESYDADFEVGSQANKKGESNINKRLFEGDEIVPDLGQKMDAASYETPANHEIETSIHEIQKEEKQQVKNKCGIRPVKRAIARKRRPLNKSRDKSLLAKMFLTLKGLKKDNKEMMDELIQIKRNQTVLRNKLVRTNTELLTVKDLLYVQTPKKTITLDRSFVLPKMPIESIVGTLKLERNCLDENYCDQLAVRFQKLTAIDTNDVKPAIKRIMDHIFTYEHLMDYSWTGKSEINSGTNDKEQFSILIGIQSMVRKAATLKIHTTPAIDKMCKGAIHENVRRASQNFARQNANIAANIAA